MWIQNELPGNAFVEVDVTPSLVVNILKLIFPLNSLYKEQH